MQKTLGTFVFLFAISTLISQTAMDLFASLFTLGAVLYLYKSPSYRNLVFRKFGWEKILAFLILTFALSVALGMSLVASPAWYKLAEFRWILLAWLIGNFLRLHSPERKHLIWFSAIFAICSAYAVLISFLGFDPIEPQRVMDKFLDGTVRTGGFHQQPIVFAQLYAVWVSFFLGYFIFQLPSFEEVRTDPGLATPVVVAAGLGTLALILSFTRGVWIAVPATVLILILLRRWTWAVAFFTLNLMITFALSFFWPAFESRILQAVKGGDGERIWIWKANFEMFLDHPWLGVGYSHNVQLLPEYFKKVGAPLGLLESHAHNQFLHILVGVGLVGFAAYLLFWSFIVRKAYRTVFSPRSVFTSALSMGVLAALITFLFGGIFESNYEHSKIRYTLAMILALLIWLDAPRSSLSQASR